MIDERIMRGEAFSAELERYWQELKDFVKAKGVEGKVEYMDFVGADTYEETVQRAYITSFLITYGYATLEIRTLEEEIFICPLDEPVVKLSKQAVSIPIALSCEGWQKWKRGEKE